MICMELFRLHALLIRQQEKLQMPLEVVEGQDHEHVHLYGNLKQLTRDNKNRKYKEWYTRNFFKEEGRKEDSKHKAQPSAKNQFK